MAGAAAAAATPTATRLRPHCAHVSSDCGWRSRSTIHRSPTPIHRSCGLPSPSCAFPLPIHCSSFAAPIAEGDPWSGHMALPGGRREPGDPDLVATVIREVGEEVGISLGARTTRRRAGRCGPPALDAPAGRRTTPPLFPSCPTFPHAESGSLGSGLGAPRPVAQSADIPIGPNRNVHRAAGLSGVPARQRGGVGDDGADPDRAPRGDSATGILTLGAS